jgi:hypothetical protein
MKINVASSENQPCTSLKPSAIAASANGSHSPTDAIDNKNNTEWSNPGILSWIQADLGSVKAICSIDILSSSPRIFEPFGPISISASNESVPMSATKMFDNSDNLADLSKSLVLGNQNLSRGEQLSLQNYANSISDKTKQIASGNADPEKPGKAVQSQNKTQSTENYKPIKDMSSILARYVRITVNGTSVSTGVGHIEELEKYNGSKPVAEISFNRGVGSPLDRVLAWPKGILFDNNMAYVGSEKYDWVSLIDLNTHNIVPIPVGRSPTGIAFDTSKDMIYVTNRDSDTVSIINATSKSSFPVALKHR